MNKDRITVGDKVKFMEHARGTDSVGEVERTLIEQGVRRDDVFEVMDTDYEADGDVQVSVGSSSVWVYPWYLEIVEKAVADGDVNILESKIRRAIDFLEVDWISVDIDRVLKLAKELI